MVFFYHISSCFAVFRYGLSLSSLCWWTFTVSFLYLVLSFKSPTHTRNAQNRVVIEVLDFVLFIATEWYTLTWLSLAPLVVIKETCYWKACIKLERKLMMLTSLELHCLTDTSISGHQAWTYNHGNGPRNSRSNHNCQRSPYCRA